VSEGFQNVMERERSVERSDRDRSGQQSGGEKNTIIGDCAVYAPLTCSDPNGQTHSFYE